MLQVRTLHAFSDNYIWLLTGGTDAAFVVDPGDAAPVRAVLAGSALRLAGILVTHHHPDHVGGVEALRGEFDPPPNLSSALRVFVLAQKPANEPRRSPS